MESGATESEVVLIERLAKEQHEKDLMRDNALKQQLAESNKRMEEMIKAMMAGQQAVMTSQVSFCAG